jgi:tetratricopeptide (TPR) repeat protein
MRIRLATTFAVLVLAATARADEVDNVKLQGALRLPTIPVMVLYDADGLTVTELKPEPEKEIEKIRKTLTGKPDDADRYARLGRLHREIGDDRASREAFDKAVALYRGRVEAAPADADLLVELGTTLASARQWDEADKVLRQAVRLAPQSWKAWTELGWFVQRRATAALFGGPEKWTQKIRWGELYALAADGKFTPEDAASAGRFLDEAGRCYDKAVAVAPERPEPYAERAGFRFSEKELRATIDLVCSEKGGPLGSPATPEVLDDFRTAVALGMKTPHVLATAAFYEMLAGTTANGPPRPAGGSPLDALPEANREQVCKIVRVLQEVAEDKDPARSAEALSALSALQSLLLADFDAAEKNVRRLLKLQPNNEPAWDMLLTITARHKDEELCLKDCLERLEHCDSAHGRLITAKTYVRLGHFDKAEEHYRAAVKLAPRDFLANLSLATLLLKRAHDRDTFLEAFAQVERTGKLGPEGIAEEHKLHYAALVGVIKTIGGEEEEARQIFERVLFQDPEHELAREALEILKK